MAKVAENTMEIQVAEVASDLGYEAIIEPDRTPFRLFGWFRERQFRPDVVVKHQGRVTIVVTKSRPAMMYDIFLTHQVRRKEDTGAIICVSDAAYHRVRDSSREYANDLNVRLCPLSEVGDVLKELLD
jgi:hypothetical protein